MDCGDSNEASLKPREAIMPGTCNIRYGSKTNSRRVQAAVKMPVANVFAAIHYCLDWDIL